MQALLPQQGEALSEPMVQRVCVRVSVKFADQGYGCGADFIADSCVCDLKVQSRLCTRGLVGALHASLSAQRVGFTQDCT
jgi:hypothetical protein